VGVIALLDSGGKNKLFALFTYNTYAQVYEATLFSDDRSAPAWLLYGDLEGEVFELVSRQSTVPLQATARDGCPTGGNL